MEKLFHLKENNTTVRTEIVAGLTTFMTMAYIIALNPNLLTGFGAQGGSQLWNGVFLATCIASAVGTLVMAFALSVLSFHQNNGLILSLCQHIPYIRRICC